MTNVGKILVFLIAVLSVLFLSLAVPVYATRVNWMKQYVDKNEELKKAKDQITAMNQRLELLSTDLRQKVQDYEKEQKAYVVHVEDQKKAYDTLFADHKKAREDVVKYQALEKLATAEATARREEALQLRDLLAATVKLKEQALRDNFEIQQKDINLQNELQTTTALLKESETKVAAYISVIDSYGLPRIPKDKAAKLASTPPQVEGIVKKVDPDGKFLEISIGSDDGLRKGHELHVYRMKPEGKYLGKIVIADLDADKAVARIDARFKQANFQEGDLVATRITTSQF